jgi:hypothetical protein
VSTQDFITELFCRIDDWMVNIPKHSQAVLYPSEVVILALLFALKGVGNRAFYRWLTAIGARCFRTCRAGHVCFACSTRIASGWICL